MKIAALNGSPKGKASNTQVMLDAFLAGARAAGAETTAVLLAEKEIHHCRGCFACWLRHPNQCVIQDDMQEVIAQIIGSDILVLATPLYFDNISGMLKVFMDRLVVTGDPHFDKNASGESRHVQVSERQAPELVLMSNCGFPEHSHFQVISHWIDRAALNMHTHVIGKIFTTQGGMLTSRPEPLRPVIQAYLGHLEAAGREIAATRQLSAATAALLEQKFIPDEIYIREANRYFDSVLQSGAGAAKQ